MDFWIYILIGLVLIVIIIMQQLSVKKYLKDLSSLLYEKQDGKAYLDKLNSFQGKLSMSGNKRLFMAIDGYALMDDTASIEKAFKELETKKLSYGSQIGLYQKEVQYYVQARKFDEAIKANNSLQELGALINDQKMTTILDEANVLVEIYCNRNGSLAKEMVKKAESANTKLLKGIYYYRASKCYYYLNDKANTTKYLKEAQLKLSGTSWGKHVDMCLEDISEIEEK